MFSTMRPVSKNLAVSLISLVLLPVFAQDQPKPALKSPVRGYLVDMYCVRERKAEGVNLGKEHTRLCLQMPPCVKSGYAVMTPDNQVLKFDAKGTQRAMKLLEKTDQEKGYVVQVSGKINDNEIQVSKIELLKPDALQGQ
jgi:hypothetical protein